jgi:PAS domain S-box-containing protein
MPSAHAIPRLHPPPRPDAVWTGLAFDHHPEAVLVIDPAQDRILAANTAAHGLLGHEPGALPRLAASALHPDELPALTVFTQSVLDAGSGWTNELSCRRADGGTLPIEYSARAVHIDDAVVLIAVLRDQGAVQRQRERAQANSFVRQGLAEWRKIERIFQDIERENQLILGAAGEGIYGVNAEGITTFANPAAARMLGWRAEELVGLEMHATVHHHHADGRRYHRDICPIYAAFRDGSVHRVEDEVFWRRDGTAFPVEYTSTPIRDHGRLVGAVVVFRDISDRKEAEANLRAAMDEVQRLKQRLEEENAYLQEEIRTEHNYKEIVGSSRAIRAVIRQIELVAPTDATVLITGESGTGKELIARAIHEASQRRDRPLIRVNCAAVPRELFESEFFGHLRGAFTGAFKDRAGRFELADGGTLFLDEVGEIPLELQGKLLGVLQEGQFERIGEEHTRSVDVRIIAATNRNLAEEVAERRFREDLYFRLNVFPVQSVPLRERPEDIALLASHFLRRASRRFNVRHLRLTQADIRRLQAYPWPGNVRELENVIERAAIVAQNGRLRLDLPATTRGPAALNAAGPVPATEPATGPAPALLTEDERRRRDREMIVRALEASAGKVFGPGGAAEILGIKPTTLASRIKRLGIEKPRRPG